MIDHRTDRQGDLILAAQRFLRALNAGLNIQQVLLGGGEQCAPFACAFIAEQWIAAGDEPFAGIIG